MNFEGSCIDVSKYLVPAQAPSGLRVHVDETSIEFSLTKDRLIQ